MMEIPNGRRNSAPIPVPSANGTARPSNAAIVVMRIGRKPKQAGLINRIERAFAFIAFSVQREIDHHDRILLHNADQQNDADQRDNTEIGAAYDQRKQRADAR